MTRASLAGSGCSIGKRAAHTATIPCSRKPLFNVPEDVSICCAARQSLLYRRYGWGGAVGGLRLEGAVGSPVTAAPAVALAACA